MRNVVLMMHVSLDGYVKATRGDVMGWLFRTYDDELKAWEVDLLWQACTHIMGRRLYKFENKTPTGDPKTSGCTLLLEKHYDIPDRPEGGGLSDPI